MLNLNETQTLLTAAELYSHLGYAVIPLLGDLDPTRPKVAARTWSAYQHRRATLAEITDWFSPSGGAAALGIVTGRISQMVVLDFDSADLFTDFRLRFPDLLETRTIESAGRGLPHLYFHVPPYLHIASQKRPGVDLLSDGRYVVAPPTTINGQEYRIIRGGMPHPLSAQDIVRLQTFMTDDKIKTFSSNINLMPPTSKTEVIAPIPAAIALPSRHTEKELSGGVVPTSRVDLHSLYLYWCSKAGRNEALFKTARYARDHGWDQIQTRHALTTLHVNQRAASTTATETQVMRQREAYATIRSVFTRPARQPSATQQLDNGLIPNSIRETLMQHKLTYVVRTLEGLLQAGFRHGQIFTTDQALLALKGIVGRDSVYNALNASAPSGAPLFAQRPPPPRPPTPTLPEAARNKALKNKKCFFVTEKKSGIKKRGTKQRRFKIPSIKDLCRLLGIKPSSSDPLTCEDLRSARQTRLALHRELIKRRPAEYTRRWLGKRLGVTSRTINNYNHCIPIRTRPTYYKSSLSWATIDSLLYDDIIDGAFIETLTGKRYPALRSIAARLLAKGTYICLKRRGPNFYWYDPDDAPPNSLPAYRSQPSAAPPRPDISAERDYASRPYPKLNNDTQPLSRSNSPVGMAFIPSAFIPPEPRPIIKYPTVAPLSPAQQEALAQTIYTQINGLSLKNARKLVSIHSEKHIRFALQRLQQRTNLDNPSGFFITVLRSTARAEEVRL